LHVHHSVHVLRPNLEGSGRSGASLAVYCRGSYSRVMRNAGAWGTLAGTLAVFALASSHGIAARNAPQRKAAVESRSRVERWPRSGDVRILWSRQEAYWIGGRVLGAFGERLGGSTVGLGSSETTSSFDGSFWLRVERKEIERDPSDIEIAAGYALVARHREYSPVVVEGFGARLKDRRAREGIELRFTGPPIVLLGTVVGPGGEPLEGYLVELVDPTPMGSSTSTVETAIDADGVLTDPLGRFELSGLLNRAYRVRAVDERTALVIEGGPFLPGASGVRLERPAEPWRSVHGVVTTAEGVPVPGLHVAAVREHHFESWFSAVARDGATTGTDGGFRIAEVPKGGRVLVWGEGIDKVVAPLSVDEAEALRILIPGD